MDLDEQLGAMQAKYSEIERLNNRRNTIQSYLSSFQGVYDPINNPFSMANPLNNLNVVLSSEQIEAISNSVVLALGKELEKVELDLSTALSA